MAYEDFTTYTLFNPNANITVDTNSITVDNAARTETGYVRKLAGTDHFGDFEHKLKFTISDPNLSGPNVCMWAITDGSNNEGECDTNNEGIRFYGYLSAGSLKIAIQDFTNDNEDYYIGTVGNTYWAIVTRTGTTCTVDIYSDEFITKVDTITITCSTRAYDYIYAFSGRGGTGADRFDLVSENLDLQEAGETHEVSGTSVATSTISGITKLIRKIVSTIVNNSTVTAIANVVRKIITSVVTSSAITGLLKLIRKTVSVITVSSSVSGTIKVSRKISGEVAIESDVSGRISFGEIDQYTFFDIVI